jgi:hypothetical protein
LDTVKNRFFSYLTRIDPSDDAFVGNEDPNAVPVFDTNGRFASTQNPASVQRIPWGTIILGFSDCSDGVVYYQPTNPAFPSGMYLIERVVPGWYPLNYKCGASSLEASYPLPVG